jgi:hypothetical protein
MRIGPSFIKIGKAILYPVSELDRLDKFNLVVWSPPDLCRWRNMLRPLSRIFIAAIQVPGDAI